MNASKNRPLAGRVALVTGANTGIGLVTARELAQRGAHLFIACRSAERGDAAAQMIRRECKGATVEALALDLGDFASIRACAENFLARDVALHILINNAGVAGAHGLSSSGFELAFGVNHVGHFLLTTLLLDRIKASAPARIVTVASKAHYRAHGINWEVLQKPTQSVTGLPEYGVSKLANVLFSAELGRQLEGTGVHTYSLHPGVIASDVWRSVPWPLRSLIKLAMITTEEGAKTSLFCASDAAVSSDTGLYYDSSKIKTPSRWARDEALAKDLWSRSLSWTRTTPV